MRKNFLIVGGTKGIGLALSRQLIQDGHNISVIARNQPQEELDCSFYKQDVTSPIFEIDLNVDHLDGLIYCPGTIHLKPFSRLTDDDFFHDFNINVLGAIKIIRHALPLLKKSDQASIVLFSTVAAKVGMPFHTSISTAKGAVEGLAKSLASELAPKVRVNVVAPSLTDTPLAEKLLSSEDKRKASADRHPLKKIGEPEDISSVVEFLLSKNANWITGQVWGVDGGLSSIK